MVRRLKEVLEAMDGIAAHDDAVALGACVVDGEQVHRLGGGVGAGLEGQHERPLREMLFTPAHRHACRAGFRLECPNCTCKIDARIRRLFPFELTGAQCVV